MIETIFILILFCFIFIFKYLYNISAPGKSEKYCSRLSAHLAWGALSVREIVQSIKKRRLQLSVDEKKIFDMIFVDGGHSYETVKSELRYILKNIKLITTAVIINIKKEPNAAF